MKLRDLLNIMDTMQNIDIYINEKLCFSGIASEMKDDVLDKCSIELIAIEKTSYPRFEIYILQEY